MSLGELTEPAELSRLEARSVDQFHRRQPQLRVAVADLDVDVRRLRAFVREEEEAEPVDAQDRRHGRSIIPRSVPLPPGVGGVVLLEPGQRTGLPTARLTRTDTGWRLETDAARVALTVRDGAFARASPPPSS